MEAMGDQDIYLAVSESLQKFFAHPQEEARRVFHGRGHNFPGLEHLNIDWYPPVALISAYELLDQAEQLLAQILAADLSRQVQSIVMQNRFEQGSPSQVLYGDAVESISVSENNLLFEVHPGRKQNAGLFLDMRLIRQWLAENCNNKNVLNLFAYTCSLSVAALAGGASAVTNVDISKTSMEWGKRNHALNGQDLRKVKQIPYNLFTSWGRIKQYGRYDLVIIDPPTRQRGSFVAEKDYGAVVKRLSSLCKADAEVIACLNSPFLDWEFLEDLFAHYCPSANLLERMAVAPEFTDAKPERGLKICRFKLQSEFS